MSKVLTLETTVSFLNNPKSIDLSIFESIEDDAAESLSRYKSYLDLSGLTSLSDAAADSLSRHEGKLKLNGLTNLSDAVSGSLGKHKGDISLIRIQSLSDQACKELGVHEGDLDLMGLSLISDEAVKLLSKNNGTLVLSSLSSLSDSAAEALSKHNGELYLDNLNLISDIGLEALSRHTDDVYFKGSILERFKKIKEINNKLENTGEIKKRPTLYFIEYVLQNGEGCFPEISEIKKAFPNEEPLTVIKTSMTFLFNNDNKTLPLIEYKLIEDGLKFLEIDDNDYIVGPKPTICITLEEEIDPEDYHYWFDARTSEYCLKIMGLNEDDPFYFQDYNGYTKIFLAEEVSDLLWTKFEEIAKLNLQESEFKFDDIILRIYRNLKIKESDSSNINIAIEIEYYNQKYTWGFIFKNEEDLDRFEVSDNFYLDPINKKYPMDNYNIWNIYKKIIMYNF